MDSDWNQGRVDDKAGFLGMAGMGVLRFALLFGSAAVALALIIAPIADRQSRAFVAAGTAGIDRTTTGSIGKGGSYVVRRSVLQSSPSAICVIQENGARSGDCY